MDILSMEKEFRKFTQFNCPLSKWFSETEGYRACARQIGEMIDSYKDINNRFQLIVYADLLELPEYMQTTARGNYVATNAAYELLRSFITRFFAATIYDELEKLGRQPQDKLLLIMEQNRRKHTDAGKSLTEIDQGQIQSLSEQEKIHAAKLFFGLPDRLEGPLQIPPCRYLPQMRVGELYADKLEILRKSVNEDKQVLDKAYAEFCKSIDNQYDSDCNRFVFISEFYTDRRSANTNKEQDTKRNLLVQFFLKSCIDDESVSMGEGAHALARTIPEMTDEDWKNIAVALTAKKKTFERQERLAQQMADNYTDKGLAPELFKLPHEKFGVDESGNLSVNYEEKKAPKKQQKKKKKKEEKEAKKTAAELEVKHGRIQKWLDDRAFTVFDAKGHKYDPQDFKLRTADEYCEKATELTNHHLNFLSKLNLHVNRIMSNYASRSLSNTPALLRKRNVSAEVEGVEDDKNDYKYLDGSRTKEDLPVESVLKTSKRSYLTILIEYLKFNAGRSVAMTSIKEQCEWFVGRIRQIEESLKKLVQILGIITGVVAFLYVPYILIQWKSILANLGGLPMTIGSLVLPFALLGVAYSLAVAYQKRKMRKAWQELLEKSDAAMAKNVEAVEAYNELLTSYIPALRWIYEYVLDVDFYRDCCLTADAKLKHHKDKLREQRVIVGNILEDLECEACREAAPHTTEPDYTKAYCEGKNMEFYSLVDKEILKTIRKERREA